MFLSSSVTEADLVGTSHSIEMTRGVARQGTADEQQGEVQCQ